MHAYSRIKKALTVSLLVLLLTPGAASFSVPLAADSGAQQQEAAERLELNAATVEQIVALGVVNRAEAQKIVDLRDRFGGLHSYEDLEDAGLSTEQIDKLRPLTTVNFMATDCNC